MDYNFLRAIKTCGWNTSTLAKAIGKSQTTLYQSLTNPNVQMSTLQVIADHCTDGNLIDFLRLAKLASRKERELIDGVFNVDYRKGVQLIPDKTIDLVVTDPPFLFSKGGCQNPENHKGKMARGSFMLKNMANFGEKQIYELLASLMPKFKKGYNAYFFCSELQLVYYLKWADEERLKYNVLVWQHPNNFMLSKKFFRSNIDYIVRIFGARQSLKDISLDIDIDNMELFSKIRRNSDELVTEHETEKPISLIKEFVMLSSNKGDVILDPFIGSGTTAIAAQQTGRHFIGFEIDEGIFSMAQKRLYDNG